MSPSVKKQVAHRRRDAASQASDEGSLHLTVPVVGSFSLPPPQHLAWYAGVGALAVCGIIEWPIAAVLGLGKALADNRHSKALQEFGDALDQAA
jgi:hypothetical protein